MFYQSIFDSTAETVQIVPRKTLTKSVLKTILKLHGKHLLLRITHSNYEILLDIVISQNSPG